MHHEDIRRAVPGWEPRELTDREQRVLFKGVAVAGKGLVRPAGVPVEIRWTDGDRGAHGGAAQGGRPGGRDRRARGADHVPLRARPAHRARPSRARQAHVDALTSGRPRPLTTARPSRQLILMCTWSKWLAVADPRSSIDRKPSPERSIVQIVLAPDDVEQVELGVVGVEEVRDPLAGAGVRHHEVDGLAVDVLAVTVLAAVRRELGEGRAHGAVDLDGLRLQAASISEPSGHGALLRPMASGTFSLLRYSAVTQRAVPSTITSA